MILFAFFQVYILVRLSCLRVSKQSVYKDVVCVIPLHILMPKPGIEVLRDLEL